MTFKDSDSDMLRLLGEHAGVGLWDCVVVAGDPFCPESSWCWSQEFRRMVGFTSETEFPDLVQALIERFHPDDLDMVLATFGASIADPITLSHYDMKFRVRLADETYRWFRSIGNVMHDGTGLATRAFGSLIDVHDSEMAAAERQRHSERQLASLSSAKDASQERFRQIANAFSETIAITDEAGIVKFWNDASVARYGIPADEIVGRHIDLIRPPEQREREDFLTFHLARAGRVQEAEFVHRDGTRLVIDLSVSTWTEGGQRCFGFIARDTVERKANEAHLAALALRDPLTELPNRAALGNRLAALFEAGVPFTVMMVDLDGFKKINDTLGHEAGDLVLKTAARRMTACLGKGDLLARFGGDEFCIVSTSGGTTHARTIANAVIQAISRPIGGVSTMPVIGASVGIATAPIDGASAPALLASADAALYAAKTGGRGCFEIATPALLKAAADLDTSRRQLQGAVDRGEFEVFYQPQYRLTDHRVIGAEALLRWRHPTDGLITPDRFLSALENSPLAGRVGDFVLREACLQLSEWRRLDPDFRIAVNLFEEQLRAPDLPSKVGDILAATKLPGSALELELPETLQPGACPDIHRTLSDLRSEGVGIALDDFGTGYASLATLKAFPITRLKIDKSFVQGMAECRADLASVEATLLIGRRLDVPVIAEGIESLDQEAGLLAQGCLFGQGYLFGPPMSVPDFETHVLRAASKRRATVPNRRESALA